MQTTTLARLLVFLAAMVAPAAAQLMVPDSGTADRVMLFSRTDGSLIDADWITDVGAVDWEFTTPKEAIVVGDEIWVSDQVADAIVRFARDTREFIGLINTRSDGGPFDNLRGMGTDGQRVYLTLAPTGTANDGVAVYEADGTPAAFFLTPDSPFDVEPYQGGLLIDFSSNDDTFRYSTDGAQGALFAPDLDFPQQVVVLEDDSVIIVSSIGANGVEGVWHLNSDGTTRAFISTEPIEEQVPRGAYPLDDGGYLLATSIGVFRVTDNGGGGWNFESMLAGVSAQYVTALPSAAGVAADMNCDGNVDFFDIDPFILALFDPVAYAAAFPNCNIANADVNGDGDVNFFDIDGFVACIFGACP